MGKKVVSPKKDMICAGYIAFSIVVFPMFSDIFDRLQLCLQTGDYVLFVEAGLII